MKTKFWLLARADYAKNKRSIFIILSILFLSLLAAQIYYEGATTDKMFFADIYSIYTIILMSYAYILLSFMDYVGKGAVLITLIPASRLGKFIYIFVRNVIVFPFTTIIIYYINHSIRNIITGTDYALWFEYSVNDVLNIIINCVLFFVVAILFKRLRGAYALLLVPIMITFSSNDGRLQNAIFNPGFIPYDTADSIYITIGAFLLIAAMVSFTWMKFKNLQIK